MTTRQKLFALADKIDENVDADRLCDEIRTLAEYGKNDDVQVFEKVMQDFWKENK